MYDKLGPLNEVTLHDFIFKPSRYEIWSYGQNIQEGTISSFIALNMVESDKGDLLVSIVNNELEEHIQDKIFFDKSFVNMDRIILVTVPTISNIDDFRDYAVFKAFSGIITRNRKDFSDKEPFVCSLFLLRGQLSKVTFTLGVSKKLIEFYL